MTELVVVIKLATGSRLGVQEQEDSLATPQETHKDDARTQLFELYPVGEDEVTRKRRNRRVGWDGPWICFREEQELHLRFVFFFARGAAAGQLRSSAAATKTIGHDTAGGGALVGSSAS